MMKQLALHIKNTIKNIIGIYELNWIPSKDLEFSEFPGSFEIIGKNPQFTLNSDSKQYPSGPVELIFKVKTPSGLNSDFSLFYDLGLGFNNQDSLVIPFVNDEASVVKVFFPKKVRGLRIDPSESAGEITLKEFRLKKVSKVEVLMRVFKSQKVHSFKSFSATIKKGIRILRIEGIKGIKKRLLFRGEESYSHWIDLYDSLKKDDLRLIKTQIESFSYKPLFSIIMPVYNTPEKILREAINSVTKQFYTNWELCIADDYSNKPEVKMVLEEYERTFSNVHVKYREVNGNISVASNDALNMAKGEFVVFMDHDDLLSEKALYFLAVELNKSLEIDFIYSDEDKIDSFGHRYDPYFKPDWNPLLFLGQNYLNHLTAIRRSLVENVREFRKGLEGSQDWDLYLRVIEKTSSKKIVHIPRILYHWRATAGSTALAIEEKSYVVNVQRKVLTDHFARIGTDVKIEKLESGYWNTQFSCPGLKPMVSIIIPTRDKTKLLRRCVESILLKTSYDNYEILIVDNSSQEDESIKYLNLLKRNEKIRVIDFPEPFNFSRINNYAVSQSQGSIVLLLNNDTEIITPDWLEQLISYSNMPEIGAVGTMLYYPDKTIQHAGVILGIGGVAAHAYSGFSKGSSGQFGRLGLVQNMSAVTAACLAIEKKKYLEVGGLNEEDLKIAFNDVDFCIRLLEKGYRNLWTPHVELYHFESASRGYEDTPEKKKRFELEVKYMQDKWGEKLVSDPAYNPNLSLSHSNFKIPDKPRIKNPWE
ncbi:MAG: glycosyltransferase family 2 protein [Anaerolineaceae bacterium]|nr:glycosyltransferase family 2 protein [Anaerolineaceae bacterium]